MRTAAACPTSIFASFEEGNIRKSLFEIATQPAEALYGHYRYKKFLNKYPDHDRHIVLMRSSEILLIEAESKARLHDVSVAVAALNELHRNRNLPDLNATSFNKSQIVDEILRELRGESFRLYDILKLQTATPPQGNNGNFYRRRRQDNNGQRALGNQIPRRIEFNAQQQVFTFSRFL